MADFHSFINPGKWPVRVDARSLKVVFYIDLI